MPDLERDLKSQIMEYKEKDSKRFIEAASSHDEDDWERCVEILTPFYEKMIQ